MLKNARLKETNVNRPDYTTTHQRESLQEAPRLWKSYQKIKIQIEETHLWNWMKIVGFSIYTEEPLRKKTCFSSHCISKIIQLPKDMERGHQIKLFQQILNSLQGIVQGVIIEAFT